jgi:flagellar hook-associated protein FlgK
MGFSGLNISISGLHASQAGLEVTSNNIANANTEGYTRKMIHFSESSSSPFNQHGISRLLTGVQVSAIDRVRNAFVDNQIRQQSENFNFDRVVAEMSIAANDILGEPSDSGLSAKLNQFFQAASDYAANPEIVTARSVFINSADALAKAFNQIDQSFDTFQNNITSQPDGMMAANVNQINDKLAELFDVHTAALVQTSMKNPAADLQDKRDLLLDQLSEMMDFNIEREGNGDLNRLSIDVHATEARAQGTVSFLNTDSPIGAIVNGSNSLELSVNDGNGKVIGPFTVNLEEASTPRDIVKKINDTFKAAGGVGEIASMDSLGYLNLSTLQVEGSVNNSDSEINIIGGSGTLLDTLGLTAGAYNGTDATKKVVLDNEGVHFKLALDEGDFIAGVNPSRLKLVTNDEILTNSGFIDKGLKSELGGLLYSSNTLIPAMQNELSDFAMSIKDSVNKVLQLGKTSTGNQGAALFDGNNAGDFSVIASVVLNPSSLAQGKTGAISDGSIMAEIADLFTGSKAIIGDMSVSEKIYIDSPSTNAVQSRIALIPGETLTIHADGLIDDNGSKVNAGQNGFGTGSLVQIQYRDADGNLLGAPVDFPPSAGAPETRVSFSGTVPANAAFVEVVMNPAFNDANLANNTGHFGIQVLQGSDPAVTANFNTKIANVISDFGTQGSAAISYAENSEALLSSLTNRRDSIIGVSVEEEASNMLQMQNAFAANARVIRTWDEIYQTIINLF